MQVDVLIVGAGPAGATAAWALRGTGAEVLWLDRAQPGRDKPCGEFLSPQGLALLAEMNITDSLESLPHCRPKGVVFHNARGVWARGHYVPFMGFHPASSRGLAVRRTLLDPLLEDIAVADHILSGDATPRSLKPFVKVILIASTRWSLC